MNVFVKFEADDFFYQTEFSVHEDYVQEVGTPLKYDPKTGKGYQIGRNGQRIALTSYAAFGDDINRAHEAAAHWCEKAQRAYDMVYGD
jgi:hypothetical protein